MEAFTRRWYESKFATTYAESFIGEEDAALFPPGDLKDPLISYDGKGFGDHTRLL